MPQSTSTLIEVANEVLIDLGERPILNFGSNLGSKVRTALTSALYDICFLDDWSWMQVRVTANSWNGNQAILNNVRRLYKVQYQSGNGERYWDIPYVFPQIFDGYKDTPYSDSNTRPLVYTTGSELSAYLNPHPTTNDERGKIWFTVISTPVVPNQTTNTLPIPQRFVELVKKRALYYLAIRHLGDVQMAQLFSSEYEILAKRLRDTERSHEAGVLNMFRRRV